MSDHLLPVLSHLLEETFCRRAGEPPADWLITGSYWSHVLVLLTPEDPAPAMVHFLLLLLFILLLLSTTLLLPGS